MAKEKVIKTNAIRMLDKAKVPYVHRSWELSAIQIVTLKRTII